MTSAIDEALQTLTGHEGLILRGQKLSDNVSGAITSVTAARTIESAASTITVELEDPLKEVIKSGILAHRITAHLSPFTYELAAVRKMGPGLELTFEDQVVAELRRHNRPMSVGAGRLTHVQFAKRMVSEAKWIRFHAPYTKGVVGSKEPLTRGDPTRKHSKKESTWDALVRMSQERGWRVFTRGNNEVWYVPDAYFMEQTSYYPLSEENDEVDNIDFDMDEGKPSANLVVTARSALWSVPPGTLAVVSGLGPADDKWIIHTVSKLTTGTTTNITAAKPQPRLPEPSQPSFSAGGLPAFNLTALPPGFTLPTTAPPPARAMPGNQDPTIGSGVGGFAPPVTNSRFAADFIQEAMSQVGKAYVYGSQDAFSDPNPGSFDCSMLVQWAAARVGVKLPRTSGEQYQLCRQHGTMLPVANAKHMKGTILFLGVGGSEHVAISLGDGLHTIEARGRAYGVNEQSINNINWMGAAYVPGMFY